MFENGFSMEFPLSPESESAATIQCFDMGVAKDQADQVPASHSASALENANVLLANVLLPYEQENVQSSHMHTGALGDGEWVLRASSEGSPGRITEWSFFGFDTPDVNAVLQGIELRLEIDGSIVMESTLADCLAADARVGPMEDWLWSTSGRDPAPRSNWAYLTSGLFGTHGAFTSRLPIPYTRGYRIFERVRKPVAATFKSINVKITQNLDMKSRLRVVSREVTASALRSEGDVKIDLSIPDGRGACLAGVTLRHDGLPDDVWLERWGAHSPLGTQTAYLLGTDIVPQANVDHPGTAVLCGSLGSSEHGPTFMRRVFPLSPLSFQSGEAVWIRYNKASRSTVVDSSTVKVMLFLYE
jgi:hypothetical protein